MLRPRRRPLRAVLSHARRSRDPAPLRHVGAAHLPAAPGSDTGRRNAVKRSSRNFAEALGGEWQLTVQITATVVGCQGCGVRAELHGRRTARVRDLPIGGRPVVLLWRKRIWRCREPACSVRTWTSRRPLSAPGWC
jgi:hypothetical protein